MFSHYFYLFQIKHNNNINDVIAPFMKILARAMNMWKNSVSGVMCMKKFLFSSNHFLAERLGSQNVEPHSQMKLLKR